MTPMVQEFTFSEAFLARCRRYLLILCLMIPISVSLPTLIGGGSFGLAPILAPVWIANLLIFLFAQAQLRKWGRLRLLVRPDGIVRESGKQRYEVPWERVRKVQIHEDSRGEPGSVQIFPQTGPSFLLAGFEAMPDVVALVQAGLPATVPIEVKRYWWSPKNLFLFAAFLAACMIVGQVGARALDALFGRYELFTDFFVELCMIVVAIVLLATLNTPEVFVGARRQSRIYGLLLLAAAAVSILFRVLR